MNRFLQFCTMLSLSAVAAAQGIGGALPVEDAATEIQEHLGETIPLDLTFRNERNELVKLSSIVKGDRPVLLNIGYFGCPSLCGAVTKGMVSSLKSIEANERPEDDLVAGRDFDIITVSFDPKEFDKQSLVVRKKAAFVANYGHPEAAQHWHFLRGDETSSKALADAVGFTYRWNQTNNEYDHRAVLILLSPNGKVTRYLYGAYFEPRTLRLAVVEASDGKIGTTIEKILLSCYGYDPNTKSYSKIGFGAMAVGGALTLLALATLLFVLWRQSARRHPVPATATT